MTAIGFACIVVSLLIAFGQEVTTWNSVFRRDSISAIGIVLFIGGIGLVAAGLVVHMWRVFP